MLVRITFATFTFLQHQAVIDRLVTLQTRSIKATLQLLMMLTYIIVTVVSFLIYVKWRQTYWQRRGIPCTDFTFFYGHSRKFITGQVSFGESTLQRYRTLKSLGYKHAGIYIFWRPLYVAIDRTIIKHIMQLDADSFLGHGGYHHPKDILTMHLFSLEGKRWKELRANISPAFTSGKIKMMFETLLEKTEGLERAVGKYADIREGFVIKDILGRFTTDVIASCAFGIECDSLEDPDNIFRMNGKKVIQPKLISFFLQSIFPPGILANMGYKCFGHEVTNFFVNVVEKTIQAREQNEIFRQDFMHLLLQLKNQGIISDSQKVIAEKDVVKRPKHLLSVEDIIAQCFIFFGAGFETSSTTMTFALLELAQNFEIQGKLRREVNEVLEKYDGKFTYEAVAEMQYLDNVINETLRKFPPAPAIPRVCTKAYKLPDSEVIIEKGTRVEIPVWGIHRDPEYYPNPDIFDPERFTEKNRASRPEFTFLPFGAGPRICIGMRFGMLQSKVGLATLIRNFKFTLSKKTPLPLEMEKGVIILTVKGNVWVDATRI